MRLLLVLLLAPPLAAQETLPPEPGPVPVTNVTLGRLEIPVRDGDARAALALFVEAHDAHEAGDEDAALRGYLAFLGTRDREDLPARYETTVRARLDAMLDRVHLRFAAARDLYARDRAAGLRELVSIAQRYPMLPEGRAANTLWQSDALLAAIEEAKVSAERDGKEKAAKALEEAIRRHPAALYLYTAKSLLLTLGGPDLFDPGERVADGSGTDRPEEKPKKKDDDGETVIEIGE